MLLVICVDFLASIYIYNFGWHFCHPKLKFLLLTTSLVCNLNKLEFGIVKVLVLDVPCDVNKQA